MSNFSKTGEEKYLDLRNQKLSAPEGIDLPRLEKLAKIMRALEFAAVEAGQSGHPGGSSSKTEQFLSLVFGGFIAFDPLDPKNSGRDRVVWSAGHCTPAIYAGLSLIYESLRRVGKNIPEAIRAVFPEDLVRFRHSDGIQGHAESYTPLVDASTGSSGHGLSAAGGMAIAHKSCGLDTKVWVLMGDAETEEGMSYEARNILQTLGAENLIVTLDYNHFGIDGDINEVISTPYLNHWLGLGWNVAEVEGENFIQLVNAYSLAAKGFGNGSPTVVLSHCVKGKGYGALENTANSHGMPLAHDEYVKAVKVFGFDIPGEHGKVIKDIEVIISQLEASDCDYIISRLELDKNKIIPVKDLVDKMKKALPGRPLKDPLLIKRPATLPPELVFDSTKPVATRKATQAWFKWLMEQTAFFYVGAGDLSKSILTGNAENVYGLINRQNPLGRGIRFGIAEQNMAMFSAGLTQDVLPGNFHPVSAFSSYAVFTSMMSNAVRMALVGNFVNPAAKGFFIMLAAHDGPETGEDGPTHQGLFWMSLFSAYPGIKVYKPMDANETIEMLFYALEKGEPIALSVTRPDVPVFDRLKDGAPPASEAVNGAYVYRQFKNNSKRKAVLVICGGQVMANTLAILPELESGGLDVKIIAVTSPQLYEELRKTNPKKAQEILSDSERPLVITLHNGWKGFLYPFLLPPDYASRAISIDYYLKSGKVDEVYAVAKLSSDDIKERVLKAVK